MEQFGTTGQFDAMEQIDMLVSSLQELDVTEEGREALVSEEAHLSGMV